MSKLKKLIPELIFLLVLCFALPCLAAGSATDHPLPGDVNMDGIVDGRDSIRLMKYLAEEIDPETQNLYEISRKNADVNGDANVDELDLLRLVRYLGGENIALLEGKTEEKKEMTVRLYSYYMNNHWHLEATLKNYEDGIKAFYFEALYSDDNVKYSSERMKVLDHNILNNIEGIIRISEDTYIMQLDFSKLHLYALDGAGNEFDETVPINHGEIFDITVGKTEHPALEIRRVQTENINDLEMKLTVTVKANEKMRTPYVVLKTSRKVNEGGIFTDTHTLYTDTSGGYGLMLTELNDKVGMAKAEFVISVADLPIKEEEIEVCAYSAEPKTSSESKKIKVTFPISYYTVPYEVYYSILSHSKQPKLLEDPLVYYCMYKMLLNDGVSETNAIILMEKAKNAKETFSNLYCWSFGSYSRAIDKPDNLFEGAQGAYETNDNTVHLNNKGTAVSEVWFHESGHAIDRSLDIVHPFSASYGTLKEDLYNTVESYVIGHVEKAAANAGVTLSESEKNAIVNEILGPNNVRATVGTVVPPMPESLSDMDTDNRLRTVWEKTMKEAAQYYEANYKIDDVKNFFFSKYFNSYMILDMISGYTNNTIKVEIGHAWPITDDKEYWYESNGQTTYFQVLEAWAEYFSSVITGTGYEQNRSLFKDACITMDRMAEYMLEVYKQRYSK